MGWVLMWSWSLLGKHWLTLPGGAPHYVETASARIALARCVRLLFQADVGLINSVITGLWARLIFSWPPWLFQATQAIFLI